MCTCRTLRTTLRRIPRALEAYLRVFMVSSWHLVAGETLAIMKVIVFPPNESCSTHREATVTSLTHIYAFDTPQPTEWRWSRLISQSLSHMEQAVTFNSRVSLLSL